MRTNWLKMSVSEIKYLLTIYKLSKTHNVVRSVDVAENMQLTKVSVCRAADRLEQKKYVKRCPAGLQLTDAGQEKACFYDECTDCIKDAIIKAFGIRENIAKNEAVGIAGALSQSSLTQIIGQLKNEYVIGE